MLSAGSAPGKAWRVWAGLAYRAEPWGAQCHSLKSGSCPHCPTDTASGGLSLDGCISKDDPRSLRKSSPGCNTHRGWRRLTSPGSKEGIHTYKFLKYILWGKRFLGALFQEGAQSSWKLGDTQALLGSRVGRMSVQGKQRFFWSSLKEGFVLLQIMLELAWNLE